MGLGVGYEVALDGTKISLLPVVAVRQNRNVIGPLSIFV